MHALTLQYQLNQHTHSLLTHNIPVQNLYNWQRNHSDKIAERLKAGDAKATIISALVQEMFPIPILQGTPHPQGHQ